MHLLSGENLLLILLRLSTQNYNALMRSWNLLLKGTTFFSKPKTLGQGIFQGLCVSRKMQYMILVPDLHVLL
jgi:hypothetical protein